MEIRFGKTVSGPVALVVGVVLFGAVVAYFSGLIQTLGYETRHKVFHGFATDTKSGGGFGLKHMLFFEGQTFFAEYEAEVNEGSLRIGILETFGPIGDKPHFVESIGASGSGEVAYLIPKTGIYSLYFEGSVLGGEQGGGYDVAYNVRWGAR